MIFRYGLVGVLLFWGMFCSLCAVSAQTNYKRIKCICIDAGHGGKDPGCVGKISYEKNIVLKVALKLGKLIREKYPDVKVVYTRDKDVFIELGERGKIANNHKADLFISLHVNSIPNNTKVSGIETYVLGLHKTEANLQVAMKENEVIKYEDDYSVKYSGFDPSRAESYIIFSMMQNLYLGNSLRIAGLVQNALIEATHNTDRSVRQAGYLVLKDVAMPAILIEMGFISNPNEERFLNTVDGQNKIAKAIALAFGSYKEEVERNSMVLAEHAPEPQQEGNKTVAEAKPAPAEEKGLFYAVQIASASTRLKDTKCLGYFGDVYELKTGDRYRYYVKKTNNYEEASRNLGSIRKKVRDCFVIAVYNGKLIKVSEAKNLEKKLK
ncbi:N-acetylmuramoyl-L-alanine amidase family protein [Odoribacter lunatus]|uniref:N-acetylmuramoyl-L-alanine amidase family protein n=1 Tax=Odoribacter lunatus TaxID=2941335 RepID=UPI00203BFF28|nr:N-acetylmuramoyl-L-alanine amidase [Odoribacter lunatus]